MSVKSDREKIKDAVREMEEAFNQFTVGLSCLSRWIWLTKLGYIQTQMQLKIGIGQEVMHRDLVAHRDDHAKSHAQLLEGQHQLKEEQRSKLTETGKPLFIGISLKITNLTYRGNTAFERPGYGAPGQRGYS